MNKIRLWEAIIFFVGWICVLLAGADFPPPQGFIYLVLLVGLLDFIQDLYLRQLLPKINHTRTFLKNCIFFLIGGFLVAMIVSFLQRQYYVDNVSSIIWIMVITTVSVFYGILFWMINKIVASKML